MSRDVLLLVDHRDGVAEPVTYQLAEQARELAAASGGRASALLLCGDGDGVASRLDGAGLAAIHAVESPLLADYSPELFSKVAAEAVRRLEPGLFLCGHTFQGMEVAPWVAARLSLPLLPNCLGLEVEGDDLVAERLVYGQAWQARLRLPWSGTVVASMARSGGSTHREVGREAGGEAGAGGATIEPLDIDPSSLEVRTRVTGTIRPSPGEVDISRAEVVVGAGRGIRDSSNLAAVEALAEALGGVVACSRPLVDLEWMPYERQVGASGKAIRPKVYIACGISGAAQHLAGITDAETIVAINQDANAPIFRVAHYGAVADLLQVVPELTAEARRRRAAAAAD
jgi:electron transfer flavoprotein alpha subunit